MAQEKKMIESPEKMSGPEYEQMKWIGIKLEEEVVLVNQR